ncbi:MAG: transposase [Leptospirales bacterium]|nr:transposase [Leptospirales bacterium]
MTRYKHYDRTQCRMVAVDSDRQILPGSFESVLDRLIDRRFRLSGLDARYRNDETGAPAFDPRTLHKIILYAYSRGLYSSRAIEEARRTNVAFMALSGCIACLL